MNDTEALSYLAEIIDASTGEGHEGTIYQADGWMMLGHTRQQRRGWSNRPGRIDRDLAPKVRYVRTP